ncbi:MAG: phosphatase PAP2 family protein [Acidimicrobiales bacterium]|nr:phosphatase PAP2 family protein [Acidimicrobiia bacterium]NNE94687.1 phosphatase PAP2 family protein [Acidimicrobiales bacterium]NNF08830.1 phosphatase PAP2 family protein [Acidimicrobiia bacterium]
MFEDLDRRVAKWAAAAVAPRHVAAIRAVTHLGGTEVAITAGALAGLVAGRRARSWRPALHLAVAIGGQNLIHNLLKRATGRRRPDGPHHSYFAGASFPSGHTSTAAAAWPAIVNCALPRGGPFPTAAAFSAGPAVGATRILLGVHWLSDVVAGLAVGWGWLALANRLRR